MAASSISLTSSTLAAAAIGIAPCSEKLA